MGIKLGNMPNELGPFCKEGKGEGVGKGTSKP